MAHRAAARLFSFSPVATPVAVMPQLALSPTPPLVDTIHLKPVVDEGAKTHSKPWPPSTAVS